MDSNSVEAVSAMANAEIRKLYEKISELKFENETYFKKMNNALEEVENNRLIHKDEIKNYTDKINSLEEDIKKLKNEKQDLNNKINLTKKIWMTLNYIYYLFLKEIKIRKKAYWMKMKKKKLIALN